MKTIGNTPIEFLTKREYFTAMAMQGMLANSQIALEDGFDDEDTIVEEAIFFADRFIKKLNNESDEGNEV